jgi:hypothetical protein
MWPWESESEQAEREHNEAEQEGAKADFLDKALHGALSDFYSDAHNAGWDNGVANPSSDDDG